MKKIFSMLGVLLCALYANADIPVKILNNSQGQFNDNEIYVAIIGKEMAGDVAHDIYYDMAASANNRRAITHALTPAVNNLHLPGREWGYADVFTRLSDLKDHTIYLGNTFACRMFISFKSPMYMHVHDTGGYAGASLEDVTDPNRDIRWELIEFTYDYNPSANKNEIWINTSRVDAFQYPMGLELYADASTPNAVAYTKRGEKTTYQTIINKWNSELGSTIYRDCYSTTIGKDNLGGIIKQPSKVQSVKHDNIFDGYINNVWNYFRGHTATIKMGVLGTWRGRVNGDTFDMECIAGTYWPVGSHARIYGVPSTTDAIEGAGKFADGASAGNADQGAIDKTVQAMFCAAFNRGQIRLTEGTQDWDPAVTKPFTGGAEYPHNEYVRFFHSTDITSGDGRTYAFAYDDTFDQSATCHTVVPTAATVTIGGFVNGGGTGGDEGDNPGTGEGGDDNPGTGDGDTSADYNMNAGDGENMKSGYKIHLDCTLNADKTKATIRVNADFMESYPDGAFFWLTDNTGGPVFSETRMDGGPTTYTATIYDQTPGNTIYFRIMLPIPMTQAKTAVMSYTIPSGTVNDILSVDNGKDLIIEHAPGAETATVRTSVPGTLTICNINGVKMCNVRVDTQSVIDMSSWAKGAYVVRFVSANGRASAVKLVR